MERLSVLQARLTKLQARLTKVDWNKWRRNSALFLAPLGVIYVAFVTTNVNTEGIAWSDFVPNNAVLTALALYVLNTIMDFLRKFDSTK